MCGRSAQRKGLWFGRPDERRESMRLLFGFFQSHDHDSFAPGHCPWCENEGSFLDPHRIEKVLYWHPPGMPQETNVLSLILVAIGVATFIYVYYFQKRKV